MGCRPTTKGKTNLENKSVKSISTLVNVIYKFYQNKLTYLTKAHLHISSRKQTFHGYQHVVIVPSGWS